MQSTFFGRLFDGIAIRLFGLVLLAGVPLVAVRTIDLVQDRQDLVERAGNKAFEIARRGAELYREPIVEAQTLLQVAAQVPAVVSGSQAECASFLTKAGRDRAWANGFWVIGEDGRVACTTVPGGFGHSLANREHFRRAVGTAGFVLSDFFVDDLRGEPASMAAVSVKDQDGSTRVLGVTLSLDWFSRLAAEVGTENDARVLLFDGNGTLLARYPSKPEWIGKNFRTFPLVKYVTGSAKKQGWTQVDSRIGPAQIYGFLEIPGTQALLAVGFERDTVLAGINTEIAKAAFALFLTTLFAALASMYLARRIVRPLKILTVGAKAARDSSAAALPAVHGYSEVRSLSNSLNALLSERRNRECDLVTARSDAERAEEQAKAAHSRLSDAINSLPEGIAIFDPEDRLVLWNRRYDEFYWKMAPYRRAGMRFEEMMRRGLGMGTFGDTEGRDEEIIKKRLAQRAEAESSHERHLAGDRWVRVEERHISGRGTISIHVDITELKRREASFRLLFESNPLPMFVWDRQTLVFLAVNDAAIAHYGYSREQILSMTLLDIRPDRKREWLKEFIDNNTELAGNWVSLHRKADGSEIEVAIFSRPLDYQGHSAVLLATVDVTERRRGEEELRRTRTFLDNIIENLPTMVFVKDARDQKCILINRAGEEILGKPREELIGRDVHAMFEMQGEEDCGASDCEVLDTGKVAIAANTRVHTPHKGLRVLRTKKIVIPDAHGEPLYLLGISEDITEQQQVEARIRHMAHHDALTGLMNRVRFRESLDQALLDAQRGGTSVAVLCVDLDYFKDVNDALGHPIGDAMLRVVAERLRYGVAENHFIARLGGDEFAIVCNELENPEEAGSLAHRLIEVLSAPYLIDGHELVVGASIGIAISPKDGNDPDRLLKNSDMALYQAKSDGRRTHRFFEANMEIRQQARRTLESDLRVALAHQQFQLVYQPEISLSTQMIIGCEALLRWKHPERGLISPDEFIPLAEDCGLITPIGEWVLHQACAEAVRWPEHIRVAVNLSPAQFKSRNLVQTVIFALASSGLAPQRLELEITETVLLRENDTNIATLHQLRSLGVRIALDDFGTGYSSLSYLRSFPFDKIKIDRSFVKELPDNPDCRAIIRAVTELASGLGMTTTAEGVETPQQLEQLVADGCTEAQGYLFGMPLPTAEIREVLRAVNRRIEQKPAPLPFKKSARSA